MFVGWFLDFNSTAQFSGCGWVWKYMTRKNNLMGSRNQRRHKSSLHSELQAFAWAAENLLRHSTCQNFRMDIKDLIAMIRESFAWPNFSTELKEIKVLQRRFHTSKIFYISGGHDNIVESSVRTARAFCRKLYFVGCSLLVWFHKLFEVWVIKWSLNVKKKLHLF